MRTIAYTLDNKLFINYSSFDDDIDEVISLSIPKNIEYAVLDKKDLPDDSYFIDAWKLINDKIVVDIKIAKEIQLEKWREARKPLLAALDVQFMRAVEAGDSTRQSEIASQKQALRDVTSIELPDTLEDIKATWPSILGPKPF